MKKRQNSAKYGETYRKSNWKTFEFSELAKALTMYNHEQMIKATININYSDKHHKLVSSCLQQTPYR